MAEKHAADTTPDPGSRRWRGPGVGPPARDHVARHRGGSYGCHSCRRRVVLVMLRRPAPRAGLAPMPGSDLGCTGSSSLLSSTAGDRSGSSGRGVGNKKAATVGDPGQMKPDDRQVITFAPEANRPVSCSNPVIASPRLAARLVWLRPTNHDRRHRGLSRQLAIASAVCCEKLLALNAKPA
jgi:hypothetical protein